MPRRSGVLLIGLILSFGQTGWAEIRKADAEFSRVVAPFVKQYCADCHAGQDPSGDRNFEGLDGRIENDTDLIDLQDMLDQLNLGEMPPEDAEIPEAEQRQTVIDWLTKTIAEYHRNRSSGSPETILRRLNSREYRNVIRDLFSLNTILFDPTRRFPRDQQTEHLDNVGETLVTSGHLLSRYLDAAEQVVDKAMYPLQQPEVQTWSFTDNLHQQPEIDQVHRKTNHYTYLTLYDVIGADKHEGAYAPIHDFAEGVPYDGVYQIRFKAAGVNREHPYEDEFLGTDRREPLRLGIVAGHRDVGPLHKPQPVEPLLAELELSDEMASYSVRVWLDRGYTPRFTFRNGLMDARNLWSRVQKKYPELFPKTGSGIVAARYNAIAKGKLPQIHVDDIEIQGPFYDSWPRPSQRALLGEDWEQAARSQQLSDEKMRKHLERFLALAYRRPVESTEIERILGVIHVRQAAGKSDLEAYGDGIKTALCSPNFLYWNEDPWSALESTTDSSPLSDLSLASRLSAFLWSSMPDEQLMQTALDGQLAQASYLEAQVDRMLADSRSSAFVEDFLDSWLTLRDLGATPPDRNDFRSFYHYDLGAAMRQETELFTRYLLDENLSILNFLDSDFTFVNKRLAEHYDLQVPEELKSDAFRFRKVGLPDGRRGGLLGQASVLTVTANGIDTSPVVRGVWLLENILGTPPAPPPPDVEPLDPDVRGAKTIRDQLEKHRQTPSCYECHRRIDPLGFALENYDPIGGWRESYGRGARIDASGALPGGKTFEGIADLKPLLMARKNQFAKALTEKLLAYSLGRRLAPSDRPHVDRIVQQLNEDGNGFRDLIHYVVRSPVFLTR